MNDVLNRALRGIRRDGARAQRSGEPALMISIGLVDDSKKPGSEPRNAVPMEDDPAWGEAESNAYPEAPASERKKNLEMFRDQGMAQEAEENENDAECPMCGGAHDVSMHEAME